MEFLQLFWWLLGSAQIRPTFNPTALRHHIIRFFSVIRFSSSRLSDTALSLLTHCSNVFCFWFHISSFAFSAFDRPRPVPTLCCRSASLLCTAPLCRFFEAPLCCSSLRSRCSSRTLFVRRDLCVFFLGAVSVSASFS